MAMAERNYILIADKEGADRKLLSQLLGDVYDIIFADNGRQVLSEIQKRKNELAAVVLDWDIPLVSAYQIMQVMQSKRMLGQIRLFVSTVQKDSEIDKKAFGMDATAIIQKP